MWLTGCDLKLVLRKKFSLNKYASKDFFLSEIAGSSDEVTHIFGLLDKFVESAVRWRQSRLQKDWPRMWSKSHWRQTVSLESRTVCEALGVRDSGLQSCELDWNGSRLTDRAHIQVRMTSPSIPERWVWYTNSCSLKNAKRETRKSLTNYTWFCWQLYSFKWIKLPSVNSEGEEILYLQDIEEVDAIKDNVRTGGKSQQERFNKWVRVGKKLKNGLEI